MLNEIPEDSLPGGLPDGGQYALGLDVALTQAGSTVEPLPVRTRMTVGFKVPADMEGATFAIQGWGGNKWVEESVSLENGYVTTTSSNTGTFVQVVK